MKICSPLFLLCAKRTILWQFGKKEMRILMVGLDAAGKTTILYKLKLGEGRSFVTQIVGPFSNDGQHVPVLICVCANWQFFMLNLTTKIFCDACCFFFYSNPQVVTTIPTIGKLPLMVRPA